MSPRLFRIIRKCSAVEYYKAFQKTVQENEYYEEIEKIGKSWVIRPSLQMLNFSKLQVGGQLANGSISYDSKFIVFFRTTSDSSRIFMGVFEYL